MSDTLRNVTDIQSKEIDSDGSEYESAEEEVQQIKETPTHSPNTDFEKLQSIETVNGSDIDESCLVEEAYSLSTIITDDFLKCKICSEIFNQPKLLQCLHSFCFDCIEKLTSSSTCNKISCPICREDTELSCNGLNSLKTNTFMNSLAEVLKDKLTKYKMCSVCSIRGQQNTASSKCLDCHDYLCLNCAEAHTLTRFTLQHKVITIKDLQSGTYDTQIRQIQEITCQYHEFENVRYFCETCDIPVCRECILLEHQRHDYLVPSHALKKRMPELERLVSELERKKHTLEIGLKEEKTKTKELKDKQTILTKEVNDKADEIELSVEKEKLEAVEKVKMFFNTPLRTHIARTEEIDCSMNVVNVGLEFCKHVMKNGKDIEILSLESVLRQRLKQLQCLNTHFDTNETVASKDIPVLRVKDFGQKSGKIGLFTLSTWENPYEFKHLTDSSTQTDKFASESGKCSVGSQTDEVKQKLISVKLHESNMSKVRNTKVVQTMSFFNTSDTDTDMSVHAGKGDRENKRFFNIPLSCAEFKSFPTHPTDATKKPYIDAIATYDDKSVIIADSANRVLTVFTIDGICKQKYELTDSKIVPKHVTVCENTVVVSGNSKILFMSKDKTWQELVAVENSSSIITSFPLASSCNELAIIIGNFSQNPSFPLTVFSKTASKRKNVAVVNALPIHLVGNSKGHVFMSDWKGDSVRIIDIINECEIASIPDPLRKSNNVHGTKWRPAGLALDEHFNIFIADYDRRAIVTINQNGQLIKKTLLDQNLFDKPRYLTCSSEGILYLLGKQSENMVYIYKTKDFI